ncbi:hypothetical protein HAX54_044945 [Datura stramonium]|uniref:Cytochrome f large domain-containing protein n=1 Tax=Datura stramonium TaxID=4076 RepID=A0ABS8SPP9_DATST|nr:hypothetical protein [Datura stramonium]
MCKARNEGRDLAREGNEIIREASKWSPELAAACEGLLEGESRNSSENEDSSGRTRTKDPMDEDMVSLDPIEFDSGEGLIKILISPWRLRVPQAVLPDTVFEAVVRIPYDMQLKRVLANGKGLNVELFYFTGGFKLAPPDRISRDERKDWQFVFSVSLIKNDILVARRPVPGKKYSEITFPILSPDPATKKDVHFLKYPIYVGGNREGVRFIPTAARVTIQFIMLQQQYAELHLFLYSQEDRFRKVRSVNDNSLKFPLCGRSSILYRGRL